MVDKDSIWRNTKLKERIEYGDVVYYEPDGWEKKPAWGKHEGYYYYPYHDRTAMMWVTRIKSPETCHAKEFPYYSVVKVCSKEPENIISIRSYSDNGVAGKRILHWMPVDDMKYETITYMMPIGEYVYICTLGEKDGLSRGMRMFARSFMAKYSLNGVIEDHPDSYSLFTNMCDTAIRMTNLSYKKINILIDDMCMA